MRVAGIVQPLLGDLRCLGCRAPGAALCRRCALLLRRAGAAAPDGVMAVWVYEGTARSLILALKARGSRAAAEPLVEGMWRLALAHGVTAEVVSWVPGRRRDIRRRGFDHGEVLARGVARRLGLPACGLLRRTGARPDQTSLGAAERRANAAGAFRARARSCPARVLLVDDLVTTGATVRSCASVLDVQGAVRVDAVTACRA
ncbi:MAG: ComF family protein [Actinomycetota bacterium]